MFEEKKEDLISRIPGLLKASGHRRNRFPALLIGSVSTVVMWGIVLLFPHAVYRIFTTLFAVRGELFKFIFLIPIGLGFTLAYAILMIRHSDLETENVVEEGVMGHYAYQQRSHRAWLLWLIAGMFGAGNTLLMVAVDLMLVE